MSNEHGVFVTLGASNHTANPRAKNDFYATDPRAIELLLDIESFSDKIWECACGEGHLSKVLEAKGYDVISTDLINRGFGTGGVDFLSSSEIFDGDIITNPPYKYAIEFVEKAIASITNGHKVAMLLRLSFLEGISRRKLFDRHPPKTVYVASKRILCAKNGDFENSDGSAIAYAWFVWQKGFTGIPQLKWFN